MFDRPVIIPENPFNLCHPSSWFQTRQGTAGLDGISLEQGGKGTIRGLRSNYVAWPSGHFALIFNLTIHQLINSFVIYGVLRTQSSINYVVRVINYRVIRISYIR
jgi:hypothetical protein